MAQKIGLTGASGFVGSRLRTFLELRGYQVVSFRGNLLKKSDIVSFLNDLTYLDTVVHLAGTFFGDSQKLIDVNTSATFNLTEELARRQFGKIIFASSGAVYGEPLGERSLEGDHLRPNTVYGLAKKWAEDAILHHHDQFDLRYVILRLPSLYGPGSEKGVIYNFLKSIKHEGAITLHGDGMQTRNFLHVDDLCVAIHKSILFTGSDIFNISNPSRVSLNQLIEILKSKYDFKVKHEPANNNLKDLLLDVSKAQNKLDWSSAIELKESILC